jgi:hypothetical protein
MAALFLPIFFMQEETKFQCTKPPEYERCVDRRRRGLNPNISRVEVAAAAKRRAMERYSMPILKNFHEMFGRKLAANTRFKMTKYS